MYHIFLDEIISEFKLEMLTDEGNPKKIKIKTANVNRPGIHLNGYFGTFDTRRIQVFGAGEMAFLDTLPTDRRRAIVLEFFSYPIPCVIIARDIVPLPEMIEASKKYNVPLLKTSEETSTFMSYLIRYLNNQLAPRISMHGVHVDIYGEGVLILGESGVGKSETALELVKRGHVFIADDVVLIRKVSNQTLYCESPELIKHFIEIRGLGIIDVKNVFGVGAIKDSSKLNIVIKLETWDSEKSYDRLGIDEERIEILGIELPCITVPVKPGRNLAVIIEAAAMNFRQKNMGYNAAHVLNERLSKEIERKKGAEE